MTRKKHWSREWPMCLSPYFLASVKNMTLILLEILFHGISRHKSTKVWSTLTPNSMTIPCHLSRFYLCSMKKHDMDFGQVQVMEFTWYLLRKWWDFHRIWCHFLPNCRQGDMRKSASHFLQGFLKSPFSVDKWTFRKVLFRKDDLPITKSKAVGNSLIWDPWGRGFAAPLSLSMKVFKSASGEDSWEMTSNR